MAAPASPSLPAITADGTRQLVLATNVFDIDRDVCGLPPVPPSQGSLAALRAVLCG